MEQFSTKRTVYPLQSESQLNAEGKCATYLSTAFIRCLMRSERKFQTDKSWQIFTFEDLLN